MKNKRYTHYAILGLGRFGMSVLETLSEFDVNILACDQDEAKLEIATEFATHVLHANMGDEIALQNMGLGNFDVVIIASGKNFEASQIATMIAKESGAKYVIVKARNTRQKKILESIGANEVILPEFEMGVRLGRKLGNPNIIDILDETDQYVLSEMKPMEEWINKSIKELRIREKYNMLIFAIRDTAGEFIIPVSPNHIIKESDVLFVLKKKKK